MKEKLKFLFRDKTVYPVRMEASFIYYRNRFMVNSYLLNT